MIRGIEGQTGSCPVCASGPHTCASSGTCGERVASPILRRLSVREQRVDPPGHRCSPEEDVRPRRVYTDTHLRHADPPDQVYPVGEITRNWRVFKEYTPPLNTWFNPRGRSSRSIPGAGAPYLRRHTDGHRHPGDVREFVDYASSVLDAAVARARSREKPGTSTCTIRSMCVPSPGGKPKVLRRPRSACVRTQVRVHCRPYQGRRVARALQSCGHKAVQYVVRGKARPGYFARAWHWG